MQLRRSVLSYSRRGKVIAPFVIAASLALSACGGTSNKSTATSAASQSTSAATTSTTQVTGAASAAATGQSTSTTEATATSASTTTSAATATTATATTVSTSTATQAASGSTSTATGVPLSGITGLDQIAQSWQSLKSYKMTVKVYSNGASTPDVSGTVEVTTPDKTHSVITVSGQNLETITIGDTTYLKLAGTWQKAPAGTTDGIPSLTGDSLLSSLGTPEANSGSLTKTGEDTINGVKCDVYTYKLSDTTTSTIWVGQKDQLPYKITSEVDTTKTEILFSDFNTDFNIQPPM